MTQITFAISQDTNPTTIKKILENIKGVVANTITIKKEKSGEGLSHEEYMEKLKSLISSIDKDAIDYQDEKTQYILSK